jgi:hypothetical protein
MHLDNMIGWKPSCEIDGSYSAKQCRGDNVTGRFVVDSLSHYFNLLSYLDIRYL